MELGRCQCHDIRVDLMSLRILKQMLALWAEPVSDSRRRSKLTMATLRPNWFLISPSLMASGASSLMMEKSCLIPILTSQCSASLLDGEWESLAIW